MESGPNSCMGILSDMRRYGGHTLYHSSSSVEIASGKSACPTPPSLRPFFPDARFRLNHYLWMLRIKAVDSDGFSERLCMDARVVAVLLMVTASSV